FELDADREAPLQLRDEIGWLGDMERAGRDEQDVVGPHHAVLRVHGRAFDDREDVALDAFAAYIGTMAPFASRDLVDLVDEDDAGLLDALDRRARAALHVDQLLLYLVRQVFERLGHLHAATPGLVLKQPG